MSNPREQGQSFSAELERVDRAARIRRSMTEMPLRQDVSALLESLNQEFMKGRGIVGWSPGEDGPVDTIFVWGWDGQKTKGERIKLSHDPNPVITKPFHVTVAVTKYRDDLPLHFRVTGNYAPKESDTLDPLIAELPNLDVDLLEEALRGEKPRIMASRQS